MKNHQDAVLAHLKTATITPRQALDLYGCFRLASVIHRLRGRGHTIITHDVQAGESRFAKYELFKLAEEQE